MKPLFIFEMANNHQGSVDHGKKIVSEIKEVCDDYPEFDFAFKFQYRNLDTFIHPDYKERYDIKNIKRFQDTRLSENQLQELFDYTKNKGFIMICTPFDECSVDRIASQGFDYIKIASCSFTDWPLLEKIASKDMPVIASGAGSSMEELCRVTSFFVNRGIPFSLMHCVAEYPSNNAAMQLNQIDLYHEKFPEVRVGFSTHEDPDNTLPIALAVAKNAEIFEKHVGVPTDTISLNGYSANPKQVRAWLEMARKAYEVCGQKEGRYLSSEKEQSDLAALKRGVFIRDSIKSGELLTPDKIYLAFPCQPGQLLASDLSKYNRIVLNKDLIGENLPIMKSDTTITDISPDYYEIVKKICKLLKESNVVVPAGSMCEISHHYGIGEFEKTGVAMIDCINREYCKKILILLPGQSHPSHYHVKKEETFVILHGELSIVLDGMEKSLHKGDVMTVERGVNHSFSTLEGCVFEEISTTHYRDDSIYKIEEEFVSPRKTMIHITSKLLDDING